MGKSIVISPAKAKIQLTNFPKLLRFIIADTITWRKHNNTNITNINCVNSSFAFHIIVQHSHLKNINTSLITYYGIGYLMLCAFNNYFPNTDFINYSGNFNALQIQNLLFILL